MKLTVYYDASSLHFPLGPHCPNGLILVIVSSRTRSALIWDLLGLGVEHFFVILTGNAESVASCLLLSCSWFSNVELRR